MIWKINKDLKVKYTLLRLCDGFLSETLTVMMKASLALVIQLSITFPQKTDKARMNIPVNSVNFPKLYICDAYATNFD